MGFRVPLTSPTDLDTAAGNGNSPGVSVYQRTDEFTGLPVGVIEWRTGMPGDRPVRAQLASNQYLGSDGSADGVVLTESGMRWTVGFGGHVDGLGRDVGMPGLTLAVEQGQPGVQVSPSDPWVGKAWISHPLRHSDEGQLLTPAAGWANDAAIAGQPLTGSMPLQIRKSADGFVHCWGLLRRTGAATSTVTNLALIPAAFWPALNSSHPSSAYSTAGVVRVDCTTSATAAAVQHVAGSVATSAYLAVRMWWPAAGMEIV